jgi:alkylhydroperoxidase family enzyme
VRKLLSWILNGNSVVAFIVAFIGAVVVSVIGVSAQNKEVSRVPLISDHPSDPDVAKTFQNTLARGGYILNLNRMMANAPKLIAPAGAYAGALRNTSDVPRSYRELMIVRTLQVEGGDYEFALHTRAARSCGVSQAKLDALSKWRKSSLFDEKERAMLAYSDAMDTRQGPDDATFNKLSALFTPKEIVELTLTSGWYIGHAHESRALHLPIDDDPDKAAHDIGCSAANGKG